MANTLPSKTTSSSGNGSGRAVLPRLLTVDAVAEQLGTSTKTVRRWIASGALHIHRLGTAARVIRVSEEDLAVFIKMGRE